MPDMPQTDMENLSTSPIAEEEKNAAVAAFSDNEPATCGALKCYFYTPKRGDIHGAFCLLFDSTNGETLENVFWVTRFISGPALDVHTGWREFNRIVSGMGPYERRLGDKLSVSFLELCTRSVRMELFQETDGIDRLLKLAEEIRRSFERSIHYFLEFDITLERLTRRELVEAGVLSHENGDEKKDDASLAGDEQKSFAGTLVNCLPIIDPVRGVPVSELRPGDMIEVKIQGGVGASGLIQQYLSSTSQEAIFPVEYVEKKADDKIYVFLKINDEIKGLISLTKDLRLRTFSRSLYKKRPISINMDNIIFIGTLLVAVLVIFLVIRFLFF